MAALLLAVTATQAQAGFISFSVVGDSNDWPWVGGEFQPGTSIGVFYGLTDNTSNQASTSTKFTSNVSVVGIFDDVITPIPVPVPVLNGIDISGGQVQNSISLIVDFLDPVYGYRQFRLNYQGRNDLVWNGGDPPCNGMGNADGFSGATYSR